MRLCFLWAAAGGDDGREVYTHQSQMPNARSGGVCTEPRPDPPPPVEHSRASPRSVRVAQPHTVTHPSSLMRIRPETDPKLRLAHTCQSHGRGVRATRARVPKLDMRHTSTYTYTCCMCMWHVHVSPTIVGHDHTPPHDPTAARRDAPSPTWPQEAQKSQTNSNLVLLASVLLHELGLEIGELGQNHLQHSQAAQGVSVSVHWVGKCREQ